MIVINAKNVNTAYAQGMRLIREVGELSDSRNGKVLRATMPVTTIYDRPTERVLFDTVRDANPFFHLLESIWMLAGRNDVKWITEFNSTFGQFSDDGQTFNGAYGFRWRQWFQFDQIDCAIRKLRKNPTDRQVYVAMWDGYRDAVSGSKDIPCNLGIKFAVNRGALDMMVTNRSNDIIWGAYGANAVHMSVLHEYVAAMADLPVGKYYQISMDWHAYLATLERHERTTYDSDIYGTAVSAAPLVVSNAVVFNRELMSIIEETTWSAAHHGSFENPVLRTAALMVRAWRERKQGLDATHAIAEMPCSDWRLACQQWVARRDAKKGN
ncbi:pyrimidine hmase [Caudoviricetes sp.]|nr:pyrimidine hmase [Caudoviricetes sp.]